MEYFQELIPYWIPLFFSLPALLLTFIYAFLYFNDRRDYLRLWTFSWLVLAAAYFILYISLSEGYLLLMLPFSLGVVAGGFLFHQATSNYLGRSGFTYTNYATLLGFLLIIAATLLEAPLLFAQIIVFGFTAFYFLHAGYLFLRCLNRPFGYIGVPVLIVGFNNALYPFTFYTDWYYPWGYAINGVIALAMALGIIGLHLYDLSKAVHESKERFRSFIEKANDIVFTGTDRGIFTYVSPNWKTLLGHDPEEVIGTTGFDFMHPGDRTEVYEAVQKILTDDSLDREIEYRVKHKNGSWKWHSSKLGILQRDENGTSFIGVARDITERKNAEAETKQQKELLEGVINGVTDILGIQYPDQTIERYNQAGYELLGLDSEAVHGRKCYEIIGRREPCNPCATKKALQSKQAANVERYMPELGIYLDCRSNPVFDEEGNVVRIVEHLRDITAQKEQELRLRRERDYMFRIFDSMSQYVIVDSPDFKIEFLNRAARNGLGEMVGTICYEQVGRDEPCPQCPIPRVLEKEPAEPVWYTVEAFGRILEGTAAKLVNLDGSISILEVLEDVTARKKTEEALKGSERKYREIIYAIQEGYYEVDLEGNFVFINDSFSRILGFSKSELIGQNYKKICKNIEEVFKLFNRVYRSGTPESTLTVPVITKDGEEIFAELSVSLRFDDSGKTIGFRGVVRDVTERKKFEEKIRYLSFHDSLTDLYNRRFLEEEMTRLDTKRQLPISIIMVDLNGLKLINDTYGHSTGDEMLEATAEVLKRSCRSEDIVARWGGDEFVILLPGTSLNHGRNICARIRDNCRGVYVKDLPVSLSLGISVKENTEKTLAMVLNEAEDDMYKNKLVESRSNRSAVLNALLKTLEQKSYETDVHTRGMQDIALKIGNKFSLSESELAKLKLLITLHDIGKINVPEKILTKKEPLTEEEWTIIKKHPEIGYRIARGTDEFAHLAEDILSHHERWDGRGYPRGLKKDEIPLLARITAIADAYEVMVNGRPYKKAISKKEAVQEIKKGAGNQFDPALVDLFLEILEEEKEI